MGLDRRGVIFTVDPEKSFPSIGFGELKLGEFAETVKKISKGG